MIPEAAVFEYVTPHRLHTTFQSYIKTLRCELKETMPILKDTMRSQMCQHDNSAVDAINWFQTRAKLEAGVDRRSIPRVEFVILMIGESAFMVIQDTHCTQCNHHVPTVLLLFLFDTERSSCTKFAWINCGLSRAKPLSAPVIVASCGCK